MTAHFSLPPGFPPGSIAIVPARNGWIVLHALDDWTEWDEGTRPDAELAAPTIYEEPANPDGRLDARTLSAAALAALLHEEFDGHFQDKHRGGLVVRVAACGREYEDGDAHGEEFDGAGWHGEEEMERDEGAGPYSIPAVARPPDPNSPSGIYKEQP